VKRISFWIFSVGGILMAFGLVMLGAGLAETGNNTTLPTSSFVFSFGALLTGAGFVIRAREIEERCRPNKEAGQMRQDQFRANGVCSVCKRDPAIIRCNLHNSKLCGNCMAAHDTAWCEYAPCGRKSTAVGKGAWR
jgi:hypothetical protein